MEKMIDMGMAAVYGDEEENVPDANVDCVRYASPTVATSLLHRRDEQDGYYPHLDRKTLACTNWENHPLHCRRYDCRDDKSVWPKGIPDEIMLAFQGPATSEE